MFPNVNSVPIMFHRQYGFAVSALGGFLVYSRIMTYCML